MPGLFLLLSMALAQDADGDGVPDGDDACPGYDDHEDDDFDQVPNGCELIAPPGAAPSWRRHLITGMADPLSFDHGDIDGDGLVDLLVGHLNGLTWRRGLGNGTFEVAVEIDDALDHVTAVKLHDFDGDGDLDVLAAAHDTGGVALYENRVNGFAPSVVLTAELGPADAGLGDVDGDGDVDVVVVFTTTDRVVWFEATGGMGFEPEAPIGTVQRPLRVEVSDMDLDGDVEVLVADEHVKSGTSGGARWYDWTASGWVEVPVDPRPCNNPIDDCIGVEGFVVGDFVGGSWPDLLVSRDAESRIYPDVGGPGAATLTTWALNAGLAEAFDADGDGDDDVAVVFMGDTFLWENQAGALVYRGEIAVSEWQPSYGLHVADWDGDGDPDVAVGSPYLHELEILDNIGAGFFTTTQLDQAAFTASPVTVAASDVDADGDADVLIGDYFADTVQLWVNDTTSWGPPVSWAGAPVNDMGIGDLTGDGLPDLAWADAVRSEAVVVENLGAGAFGSPADFLAGSMALPLDLELADVDDDGDLDALVCSQDESRIVAYIDPATAATPVEISAQATEVRDVEVADIDGDGLPDVTWAGSSAPMGWSRNDGVGWSAQPDPSGVVAQSGGVVAGDIDRDGDVDLLRFAEVWITDESELWFESTASGFGPGQSFTDLTTGMEGAAIGDLDGSGPTVVAITDPLWDYEPHPWAATVMVFPFDGFGPGAPVELAVGLSEMKDVELADVDGDGDLDVVVASSDEGMVAWFENPHIDPPDTDGDGLYDDDELLLGTDPAVADTDGDGVDDGWEVLEYGTIAGFGDADGDGVADPDDVCPGGDDQVDADADGLPDDCDRFPRPDEADEPTEPERRSPPDRGCMHVSATVGVWPLLVLIALARRSRSLR